MQNTSFKERVCQTVIRCSKVYNEYFVKYEYLICSDAFTKRDYYIVDAHEDNFLHLTGVTTNMSAQDFFNHCLDSSLTENDISFSRNGYSESAIKGTVRRKIKVIENMIDIFSSHTLIEEDFVKNQIRCSFATGNSDCTLGFSNGLKAKPMTLLSGNELTPAKAKPIKLVIRRPSDSKDHKFDEIIYGDKEALKEYAPKIGELLGDELLGLLAD